MNVRDYRPEMSPELANSAQLWLERLQGTAVEELNAAAQTRLPSLLAVSEFAAQVLARDSKILEDGWLGRTSADWHVALENLVKECGQADLDTAKQRLRRFRNRYLVGVLWRDLHGAADLDVSLHDLSLLADRLLDAAAQVAARQLADRFGRPLDSEGESIPIVILGMGKLGGGELNFSSDIDLIFCYPTDGETDGRKSVSAQEYFVRLSQLIIALLHEVTADGFVYRVDTRLRPFGDSGPPVVSFAALESYLLRHGRDWERYAYVKARIVGPQPDPSVSRELFEEIIRPFVYRRYLDYGVFESLREMHSMIATEVRRNELTDNIKLGPGGIREAEFIVQALQLVRGGSEPSLQVREFQSALPKLVTSRGLSAGDADALGEAYRYLRRVENFLQAIRDAQTHDLPDNELDRERLCIAMGQPDWASLCAEIGRHREAISAQFAAVAFNDGDAAATDRVLLRRLWDAGAGADQWARALGGDDIATALADTLADFACSGAVRQIDSVAAGRLRRLVPRLLEIVLKADRPAIALQRSLSVVEKVLRRSSYIALLNENPIALQRFVDLTERSLHISEKLARYPVLLDELLDPRTWSSTVTRADIVRECGERLGDERDSEARMQSLAQFQRASLFRIAVADFNGLLPIMKVSDGLTWLAEAVLEEALAIAWRDLSARHGTPKARFGIVGYGKLGGLELSYTSDLDIVFLHEDLADDDMTDGDKPLAASMFFSRLVRRLVHLLTTRTDSGELYEIDMRLRPEGRSGLLVSSLSGFSAYQDENAWTWEHQALLRARAVAGDAHVAERFEDIRRRVLSSRVRQDSLRDDVVSMRRRMRAELDRSTDDEFDLKHGEGGIGDIEFLVQYLVLRHAGDNPAVVEYSDNIRQLDALVAAGIVSTGDGTTLQDIYRDYRTRLHHLSLDGRPGIAAAQNVAALRECVRRLWQHWLG